MMHIKNVTSSISTGKFFPNNLFFHGQGKIAAVDTFTEIPGENCTSNAFKLTQTPLRAKVIK